MTKAVHFISRKEGITLHGLTRWHEEPNGFRSCCWLLTDEEASDLLGGWVYFHEMKSKGSMTGGLILGFEDAPADMPGRKAILFRASAEARQQPWRGADHGMAYTSGIIDGDFPHELG